MAVATLVTRTVGWEPGAIGETPGPYPGTKCFANFFPSDEAPYDFVWSDGDPATEMGFSGTTVFSYSAGVLPLEGAVSGIPTNAVISHVRLTVLPDGFVSLAAGNDIYVFTTQKRGTGSRIHGVLVPSPHPSDNIPTDGFSFNLTEDTEGLPWTQETLLEATIFGIMVNVGAHSVSMLAGEVRLEVYFTQATPNITTAAATEIQASSAQLNAAVAANGATTAFPVLVSFFYSANPDDPESFVAGPSGIPATGTLETLVGGNLQGLAANVTYYYYAVATYDGGQTITALNVESFTTIPQDQILKVF